MNIKIKSQIVTNIDVSCGELRLSIGMHGIAFWNESILNPSFYRYLKPQEFVNEERRELSNYDLKRYQLIGQLLVKY